MNQGNCDTIKTGVSSWNPKSWLWVLLYGAGIILIAPAARSIQIYISNTIGREFFTYAVLASISIGSAALLYYFIFKLKIKLISQYIWIFVCTGLYVYSSLQLRGNPEEAVHFIEYGVLAYFIFKALSHRIQDWSIYITTILLVACFGTADEFVQWLLPSRVWDYRDITFNFLAGGYLVITIWKGIRPEMIGKPIKKISVKILAGVMSFELIVLGFCLSNTPELVNQYTEVFKEIVWLQKEEPMTEFGHKHLDSEIGTFYSRFTLEELREINSTGGKRLNDILPEDISSAASRKELFNKYNPGSNPFLYEFLIHIMRRDTLIDELAKEKNRDIKTRISKTIYRENALLEKYFAETLERSGYLWSEERVNVLNKSASLWQGDYISEAGIMITSFSLKTAWLVIITSLLALWTAAIYWIKRLDI